MRRIVLTVLIALVVGAALVTAANTKRTDAVFPGTNGRILFIDQSAGENRLSTMNPDGSDVTQIDTPGFSDLTPAFGPDGESIVFRHLFLGDIPSDGIYYKDNGTANKIPGTDSHMFGPSFAPSGDKIALGYEGDIQAINLSGTGGFTNLTNTPVGNEVTPAWSPNGDKIAYMRQTGALFEGDIWVMNADGTGQTNLTNTPQDEESQPSWSPNGERIIFNYAAALTPTGGGNVSASNIAVMNADGTGFELLINDPSTHQYDPTFSPDGTQISYGQIAAAPLSCPSPKSIVVANADGSGAVVISPPGAVYAHHDWGVDEPGTPVPTPEPVTLTWGDNNCSGSADPIDSLLTLRFDAGLPANTGNCPDFGEVVDVQNASLHRWGDVDCGGNVTPVDSLKLLRFDAGLGVTQEPGCPGMGSEVLVVE